MPDEKQPDRKIQLPIDLNGKLWITLQEDVGRIELIFGSMGVVALMTLENLLVFRRDLESVILLLQAREPQAKRKPLRGESPLT